jgi:glutathione S-transferase
MSTAPRLWSWNLSPFAGKVRIAFAEKGVPVELLEVHPVKRPARLRELNPTNRVPVLEVDGHAIRESSAICEWLEDTHPEPSLWPQDPGLRAEARGLLRWVDDELTLPLFLSARKQYFGLDETDPPDLVERLRARLVRRWSTLEGLLGRTDGPWLMGGEAPTLTDLAAIPLAVRLPQWNPELQPDPDEHPRAAAWLDALRARPSAAEVDRQGERVEA